LLIYSIDLQSEARLLFGLLHDSISQSDQLQHRLRRATGVIASLNRELAWARQEPS
jgi:hypothetical protein